MTNPEKKEHHIDVSNRGIEGDTSHLVSQPLADALNSGAERIPESQRTLILQRAEELEEHDDGFADKTFLQRFLANPKFRCEMRKNDKVRYYLGNQTFWFSKNKDEDGSLNMGDDKMSILLEILAYEIGIPYFLHLGSIRDSLMQNSHTIERKNPGLSEKYNDIARLFYCLGAEALISLYEGWDENTPGNELLNKRSYEFLGMSCRNKREYEGGCYFINNFYNMNGEKFYIKTKDGLYSDE